MKWDVEYTNEFEAWWDRLNDAEQDSVQATVMLLSDDGPHLGFPHTSDIKGLDMATSVNCECNTQAGLTVCCMPLIRDAARSC